MKRSQNTGQPTKFITNNELMKGRHGTETAGGAMTKKPGNSDTSRREIGWALRLGTRLPEALRVVAVGFPAQPLTVAKQPAQLGYTMSV
ncbi:unnamed protein product [Nippostrongylus brasiliensis]|uniref:Transposase n=1 Tax=Nippostrongylus brasiliensis TaxID=27835 RepID=A0A0N4XTJ3_NIPBR|nr:unnamed protein product [Nippostrongylus brasiliensis]